MTTLKPEHAHSIYGVSGRSFNVIVWNAEGKRWHNKLANQKWLSEARPVSAKDWGPNARLSVEVRFDDDCKNGHEYFAITGTIRNNKVGDNGWLAGGCLHEEISRYFPELAPLIKWHHMNIDGPMHYVANTTYHASNLGSDGLPAGKPTDFKTVCLVGNSPISHNFNNKFNDFLQDIIGRGACDFKPLAIEYRDNKKPGVYQFDPKYTINCRVPGVDGFLELAEFPAEWYQCPFDTKQEALSWCQALNDKMLRFERIATGTSKGKERNLEAARSCAIWPEATDKQLCLPKEELEALLLARLPPLIQEFKGVILQAGLLWGAE